MGLPKASRLKSSQDFRQVYESGTKHDSAHLILRALLDSPQNQPTKIGISISQKVSKKAVVRNRIKRQLRAILREILPKMSPGWKIVIIVRSSAAECQFEHFLRELKELLLKAKIVHGN
ncbi:ribonuclease P protein component [Gloeocapsa sp. PCC 73106]|uniref:ribonuclease P protein component n=1 Tax=Gloeocapsa sp. PCC 73106 TaxID=102232 RepID=UPI0002AC0E1B|nr:ribonuclease P protein component [Gloeocapsa sp. PCC 73106]ELR98024.1 ribonuclease P protein component [Gloeocapsa sp. PCC 73106]